MGEVYDYYNLLKLICCLECFFLGHTERPRSFRKHFRSLENKRLEREERALSLSFALAVFGTWRVRRIDSVDTFRVTHKACGA